MTQAQKNKCKKSKFRYHTICNDDGSIVIYDSQKDTILGVHNPKKEKEKEQQRILSNIHDILIGLALIDELPLDMNGFDYDVLKPAFSRSYVKQHKS